VETKIADNYLLFEGSKYFRRGAHLVNPGGYGQKRNPLGSAPYLEVQNKIKNENLVGYFNYRTTIKIDWSKSSQGEVDAGGEFKFLGLGVKAVDTASYEKAKSAKLQLMSLAINEGPLQRLLNESADGARKYLADEGGDGRIASELLVCVSAELAEHFSTSASISVALNAAGNSLSLTAKGGAQGSQTIEYEPGVTFAYRLHQVTKWNKDKPRVDEMKVDWFNG